jgi:hypothetical protein
MGTFEPFTNVVDILTSQTILAHRRCPNRACYAHVFVIWNNREGRLIASFPAERIDFDATDIPTEIIATFEEAITCHSVGTYRAAAIMVRRTLEELCRERGATGATLKDRIKSLSAKVIMPKELIEALDDLRLLGNDAAHVESQEYNTIGPAEVETGIAVTKEVLKAVFQYGALLKQLRALKKTP